MGRIIEIILMTILLSSCSSGTLRAPCPNFGAHCQRIPINIWNDQNA